MFFDQVHSTCLRADSTTVRYALSPAFYLWTTTVIDLNVLEAFWKLMQLVQVLRTFFLIIFKLKNKNSYSNTLVPYLIDT